MSKVDWEKLNEIFDGAMELGAAEQKAFLKNICNGDEDLRREAEAIIAASNRADSQDFLEGDAFAAGARILAENAAENSPTGKQIGNYRIIREIGRGGMGTIYLAEREDFHHRVALKIIKRGMDTDEIIRRFEREREVLAALSHPNIARLLDGGTTDDGLPFLVMEFVEGSTITEFCDENSLNIEERLKLFRKVCSAVAYAHQNLIVHRDLKPSNILVDIEGEPKLLDFGIARLLAPDKADQTTETGLRLLTPEYASPEQIRGERVTTAGDVYSLGVLLYELLTGQRPYELTSRNAAEIIRVVCETEPERPSSVVGSPSSVVETTRRNKYFTKDNARLTKLLKGDLDNIILKALRKEIVQRYSSVEQFAEDIGRYLTGLPILARRATYGYQFTKFIERNRTTVAFASIALIALLVGSSIAVWQAYVARQERARAEHQAAETRRLANSLMNEFDEEVGNLPGSYPIRVKLAQASSDYLDRLAQESDDPAVFKELAKAHSHLGDIYNSHLGNDAEAKRQFKTALDLARRVLEYAPDDPAAKELVAEILHLGLYDYAVQEGNYREAARLREEIVAANPSDLQALNNLAGTYLGLGLLFQNTEQQDESLVYFRRAIETRERQIALLDKPELTGDEYSTKFWALAWIGLLQGNNLNDWQTANATLQKALEIAETAAAAFPEHQRVQTDIHTAHNYLARAFDKLGDHQAALNHYEIALDSNKKAAERFNLFFHQPQARYMLKIAEMLQKTGRMEQSLAKVRETLDLRRETTSVNHADPRNKYAHADIFFEAGKLFAFAGKTDEAHAAYREAEEKWKSLVDAGQRSAATNISLANLNMHVGDIYSDCLPNGVNITETNRTRLSEALKRYEKAVQIFAENRAHFTVITKEEEKLAREKLAACKLKLNKS